MDYFDLLYPDPRINNPCFEEHHRWQSIVGPNIRKLWPTMTETTRLAIILDAERLCVKLTAKFNREDAINAR